MAAVAGPRYDMTSTTAPVSRLAELQARFQQKQLQEKEQKLLALYEEQSQQGYQRLPGPGGGKVRQLFQKRRGHNHHTGWDRSHPLEPIQDNRRGASLDRNVWNKQPVRRARSQARGDELSSSKSYDQIAHKYVSPVFGDENEYLSRVNDLESSSIFRKLPNIGGAQLSESTDRHKTYVTKKEPMPTVMMAPTTPQSRIADLSRSMAKMSPPSKKTEIKSTTPTVNGRIKSNITPPGSGGKPRTNTMVTKTPPRPLSDTKSPVTEEPEKMNRPGARIQPATRAPPTRPAVTTARTGNLPKPTSANTPAPRASPAGNLVPCKNCGRNFAPDRVQAHADICAKTSRKKRKPFDATKHRVQGTELEAYVKKGGRASQPPPKSTIRKTLQPLTKSNWRKKHEDFIANIRAAKEAQAHLAKGGKLSDLPPPPPMDTSDLIPCPHCNRKFNEAAAERHIPKCANMLHNKPKPVSKPVSKPARRY